MCLANPRRTEEQHIGLDVMNLGEGRLVDTPSGEIVMVTHGDAERALRRLLGDDVLVQMLLDQPWRQVEGGDGLTKRSTSDGQAFAMASRWFRTLWERTTRRRRRTRLLIINERSRAWIIMSHGLIESWDHAACSPLPR